MQWTEVPLGLESKPRLRPQLRGMTDPRKARRTTLSFQLGGRKRVRGLRCSTSVVRDASPSQLVPPTLPSVSAEAEAGAGSEADAGSEAGVAAEAGAEAGSAVRAEVEAEAGAAAEAEVGVVAESEAGAVAGAEVETEVGAEAEVGVEAEVGAVVAEGSLVAAEVVLKAAVRSVSG